MDRARVHIAAWVEDYNQPRPHSALGYETPAAFAAELHKQWPAPLRRTGSATPAIASPRSCATKLLSSNPSWRKAGGHVSGLHRRPTSHLMQFSEPKLPHGCLQPYSVAWDNPIFRYTSATGLAASPHAAQA